MRVMLLTSATAVALSALSAQSATPTRLAVVEGFAIPESARYDPERDQYFVSNVNAHATASDNNGYISLVGRGRHARRAAVHRRRQQAASPCTDPRAWRSSAAIWS